MSVMHGIVGAGLIGVALCGSMVAQGEVYKWVDSDGKIQYGDAPPKGVKTQVVSGGVTVVPAVRPAKPTQSATSEQGKAVAAEPSAAERGKGGGIESPSSSQSTSTADADAEARRRVIAQCEKNHGINCEGGVNANASGQTEPVYVPVPGWTQPPIRPTPRPDRHDSDRKKPDPKQSGPAVSDPSSSTGKSAMKPAR